MGTWVQTSLLGMSCDGAQKDREGHRDTLVGESKGRLQSSSFGHNYSEIPDLKNNLM